MGSEVLLLSSQEPYPVLSKLSQSKNPYLVFSINTLISGGLGSSVDIGTHYGLDGLGSNPGGDEIFRLSRLALGPTQTPVKWVPGLSRG